ncbi:hypothetical protein KIN20_033927 [Parelaphostrongylus tenuis]|uniref:Uncharacterized protein n=1 Tax=Parelaphostrongylus tenuis TaxID=148309 RepID=A0AAD5R8X0_PARTN|nr:hypothetical protein KIN20_033927 [Parelaphostrongylus tenuis]
MPASHYTTDANTVFNMRYRRCRESIFNALLVSPLNPGLANSYSRCIIDLCLAGQIRYNTRFVTYLANATLSKYLANNAQAHTHSGVNFDIEVTILAREHKTSA